MIGLSEFIMLAQEVQSLGWLADTAIQKHIGPETSKKDAIAYANQVAQEWDADYDILLTEGTKRIIAQTANHYTSTYGLEMDLQELTSGVQAIVMTEQFYGATLARRKAMNMLRMKRIIQQTAQIDPEKLGGLFTEPVPFGAQNNVARRLLLGTAVHTEHETARAVADKAGVQYVKWTLSHKHQQEDACDNLANYTSEDAKAYVEKQNLAIDPAGLYSVDDLPDPPHPNCQCELAFVMEDGRLEVSQPHPLHKAFRALRELLQTFRSK